jgi:CheY-like chemotaxis protein
MVEDMLAELGAVVVGPAATVERGLQLAEREEIDAAVLDVNVRGEHVGRVADALRARSIPIVFATGYGSGAGTTARGAPLIDKPYTQEKLVGALESALDGTR